ncbi:MAG: calcium/sodium antiporter [Clostridia bacterium]|nr:calcium/sodium antiporter [Clostridia bacterium]
MLIPVLLFAVGLVLLIKGGDWFVDGATGIAHRFHIPEILIGATVVSIGTTLPEVMVSATGAMQGSGAMAYGNAIGSIICNTSLIAALTIAIRPANADKKALRFPVIFFFGAMAIYAFAAYFFGEFARWTGILLLCGFLAYMTVLVIQAVKEMKPKPSEIDKDFISDVLDDEVAEEDQGSKGDFIGFLIVGASLIAAQIINIVANGGLMTDTSSFGAFVGFYLSGIVGIILAAIGILKAAINEKLGFVLNSNVLFLILGAAVIALGADLLVDNGIIIAEELGVPQTVISLTFVALGTSLPELVTAVTALLKGHSSLSLGNVIGANIFNLVLVSGTAITINPFVVPAEKLVQGMNASLVIDIPIVFIVMGLMTIPALIKGKLSRWQGITLLCIYAAFCVFQFAL